MAPPGDGDGYLDEDNFHSSGNVAARIPPPDLLEGDLITMSIENVVKVLPTPTDDDRLSRFYHLKPYPPMTGPPTGPPPWATNVGPSLPDTLSTISPTWTTSMVTTTPQLDMLSSTQTTSSIPGDETQDSPRPTYSPYSYDGNGTFGWGPAKHRMNNTGMYAAAAIAPMVVLAVIAATVILCMRKRKRQRREAAATAAEKAEEMKMRSQTTSTAAAYMALPSTATPRYSLSNNHSLPPPSPALMQPIILGPIPSGSNGAYFTGIDTSDAMSMTSANNFRPPPNPFSDNESLLEPPPPYRPRSAAPPSFTNSSRQSSIRASQPPLQTSQTHLVGRSPFEDPFDDDMISDLSGPTAGRNEEAMSAVSDLSYQNDPVVGRSTI